MSETERMDETTAVLTTEVPIIERLYLVTTFWAAWAKEEGYGDYDLDSFGREIAAKMATGHTEYFLLRIGTRYVGFIEATIQYDPGCSGLVVFGERAYLVPEWRRKGVYGKAFETLETWAIEEKGCIHGVIEVAIENDWLVEFYEDHGFKATHMKMRRIRELQ